MKNITTILYGVAIAGVLMGLPSCQNKNNKATAPPPVVNTSGSGIKIAYVNIDSLEAHSDALQVKNIEFKKRQEQMQNELQKSYQQMQNDAAEVQKKAQSNNLTQAEYEAAQKRLAQMQQSLETRKESLTDQLLKEQQDFNTEIKGHLDDFLENYNKDKHYDFILSYTSSGTGRSVLYANKQYDITPDVIRGMNAATANNAANNTNNNKK